MPQGAVRLTRAHHGSIARPAQVERSGRLVWTGLDLARKGSIRPIAPYGRLETNNE